ncbi:MAG: DUF433 domain-containing protein [Spirulinaceae cyanobacterium]
MQIEDYFDFLSPNDIRIKNSRIGIDTILYEYLYNRQTLEGISQLYSNLTLEQIHATILYYLHNPETITQYMADWLKHCQEGAKKQDTNPPEYVLILRRLKAEKGKLG